MLSKLVYAAWLATLLSSLTACQIYEPQPLSGEAVAQALTPPPASELVIQARQFKHPLLPPLRLDLDQGLTPDQTALLAVLLNPELRAKRDQRAIAQAQLLAAGLLPNPEIGYSLEFPSGGRTQGAVNAFGLELGWDVFKLLDHSLREEQAAAQGRAVDLEVAWDEWQVAMAAKLAVQRLDGEQAKAALYAEDLTRLQQDLDRFQRAADRGLATQPDLAGQAAAVEAAQARLLEAKRLAGQQRLALLRLLGLPPESGLHLAAAPDQSPPWQPPPAPALFAGLEQRRLDLMALALGYAKQEAKLHAAVLNQFPRIQLALRQSGDTGDVVTTGFGVSIELPLFNRQQAAIAKEQATRQKLFDEYAARMFAAKADIAALLANGTALAEQLKLGRAAWERARELAQRDQDAWERGRQDLAALQAARRQVLALRLELLELEQRLQENTVGLELASGLYDLSGAPLAQGPSPASARSDRP